MWIILFIVAVILGFSLYIIGFIYSIVKLLFAYISSICKPFAVAIDKLGNVVCAELFNDTLITKEGHKFGNPNETISKVLGINKINGTLKKLGLFVANVLNRIDKNHVEDAASTLKQKPDENS